MKKTKERMRKDKGITVITLVVLMAVVIILIMLFITLRKQYKIQLSQIPEYEEPSEPEDGKIYVDIKGEKVPIPAGFDVDVNASIVEQGLVIRDAAEGSEFVWIPVETPASSNKNNGKNNQSMAVKNLKNYNGLLYNFTSTGTTLMGEYVTETLGHREPDVLKIDEEKIYYNDLLGYKSVKDFQKALQNEYNEMMESVIKYKGFYMSRYEMSLTDDSEVIQSKPAKKAVRDIWYELYRKAKGYTGTKNSVKSTMMWGSQFDAMLNWMQNLGISVYSGSIPDTKSNEGELTGYEPNDVVNNIYDLLGGCYEYTTEAYYRNFRVYRAGNYPLNYRGLSNLSGDLSQYHIGTRFTLYIK